MPSRDSRARHLIDRVRFRGNRYTSDDRHESCPFLLLRVEEFADAYLSVPTVSIIRCLVEVEFEAEHVATSANRNETAGRLAIARLDELEALHHAE